MSQQEAQIEKERPTSTSESKGIAPSTSADGRKAVIARQVARMARIGSAFAPSFSPDDKWVSFITNISGARQVWIVPAEGGYPRMVTNGEDPVISERWSPAGDWLAVTIAPGGGLNSQVYVVKPDGTEMGLLPGEDRTTTFPMPGRRMANKSPLVPTRTIRLRSTLS
jgi:dipeptidyl aminopeptidase/acylaminoacyl peptidase